MTELSDYQKEIVYQLASKEKQDLHPAHDDYREDLDELIEVVTE